MRFDEVCFLFFIEVVCNRLEQNIENHKSDKIVGIDFRISSQNGFNLIPQVLPFTISTLRCINCLLNRMKSTSL